MVLQALIYGLPWQLLKKRKDYELRSCPTVMSCEFNVEVFGFFFLDVSNLFTQEQIFTFLLRCPPLSSVFNHRDR